ncbi:hypothetical protein AJ79_00188 [Helicocarpus griseus UAMH5409]|uniref:Protein kinase domain-containing protein n=1 Tax=Helicocarpus griseus UAMH5409 TaxID=1447875 RepID=A0A2B7YBX6_9EURO|nr:hypothetical protein AJ79_00188 [Helicocarpus griseus UAMH5409]
MYLRWHADVKPDNILRVHGVFKLADFGFAKFTARGEGVAMQYIEGGTHAYGAPEMARMRDGTRTAVQQTIDTWSLGCVFSVAATWVILGFHGVKQYEMLRTLASAKREKWSSDITDSFHDNRLRSSGGFMLHKHLKSHMRASDILTGKVLDFIEKNMLQRDPTDRLKSSKLCDELVELIETCRDRKRRMLQNGNLSHTDDRVTEALSVVERTALRASIRSKPGSEISQVEIRPDRGLDAGRCVDLHPPAHKSRRLGKSAKLSVRFKPAQYRDKPLQEEMGKNSSYFVHVRTQDAGSSETHNGERTESPTRMHDVVNEDAYQRRLPRSRTPVERPLTPDKPSRPVVSANSEHAVKRSTSLHIHPKIQESLEGQPKRHQSYTETQLEEKLDTVPPLIPPETPRSRSATTSDRVVADLADAPNSITSRSLDTIYEETKEPSTVFDLPWDVCKVCKDLEDRLPQNRLGKAIQRFKKEKKDGYLENVIH